MLIAHAPAGYLITRILSRTVFKNTVSPERTDRFYQRLMFAGILGGILPDFDLIYFTFFDNLKTDHHAYLTHMPVFWLSIWCMWMLGGKIFHDRRTYALATTLCAGALSHLALDTLTGVVYWLYPFSTEGVNIFKVANIHIWWVQNYLYHWTFLIEIAITLAAMAVFLRVKETLLDLVNLFGNNRKLRLISFRLGLCVFGLSVIALVVSLRFTIDNRLMHKMIQIKHAVVRMVES
jgi:hypothetical protein